MANQPALKIMTCPTCGANLKAENNKDSITCVYCGNVIVPVSEPASNAKSEAPGFSGVLRVEGIKTSSSALAYLEQYFEEYDWEAFAYAQNLSIPELNKLANSLKVSSADDKSTWLVSFRILCEPYLRKIEGCRKILSEIITEYKKDNFEAYSIFDAYKRVSSNIAKSQPGLLEDLEKFAANAAKYGASATEISSLNSDIAQVREPSGLTVYTAIEEIPEIRAFNEEKNARIAEELAAQGIDAAAQYEQAKELYAAKKYVRALQLLLALKGYSDSRKLADEIDKYYLLGDALEIGGKLYCFRTDNAETKTLSLFPVEEQKLAKKPVIKNIGNIITNYADILYYLDGTKHLRQHDFSSGTDLKCGDYTYNSKAIYVYGRKVYLLGKKGAAANKAELMQLDLETGALTSLVTPVKEILSLTDGYMVYTSLPKGAPEGAKPDLHVLSLDAMRITDLGNQKIDIQGYVEDCVVYTVAAPNDKNLSLYIQDLATGAPARLIEQNIYNFQDIISGKLFYYVGNGSNRDLIQINTDGTGRREWPRYISSVLFEQGGWLYFIRRAGYNSILCKARLDGSRFSVIASDIDKFIDIKNGYLYYVNDSSALVKVRMDGSNLQKLCTDVQTVLTVQEDRIVFVSVDERFRANEFTQNITTVKSIYAVDFVGTGKRKLAYNILDAKEYDENTVWYLAEELKPAAAGAPATKKTSVYRLDINHCFAEMLLDIPPAVVKSKGCYIATCVYGSYDCPQVWTLRRFRDYTLDATPLGRLFIKLYYAVSPTLVKWFGGCGWFQRTWRFALNGLVSKLQRKGFEDTPYND